MQLRQIARHRRNQHIITIFLLLSSSSSSLEREREREEGGTEVKEGVPDAISMGKEQEQVKENLQRSNGSSSTNSGDGRSRRRRNGFCCIFFCERCSMGLSSLISKDFSFRCVFVLLLSLTLLVSGIFWVFPAPRRVRSTGFDANDSIKLSASIQAHFRLQNPVSLLVPQIGRLEYDIFEKIGVPNTKVAILSMNQTGAFNWTEVVFGVLSDPINVEINPVSLSLLQSYLIELFLQQTNLTLTTTIFGQPSMFEILKFPDGITIIPVQYAYIWQIPQILFSFVLNNSLSEILDNLDELNDQLKSGLHLQPYESVFLRLTNEVGSTTTPPVIVHASIMSDLGSLLPQRLKQLAQTIQGSNLKNLGLGNSVFGKVKGVRLSSHLKLTLHTTPLTPSPAPSPELSYSAGPSISPDPSCSLSLSPSFPSVNSQAPPMISAHPPTPCPYHGSAEPPSSSPSHSNPVSDLHHLGASSQLSQDQSPSPQGQGLESALTAPSLQAKSPSSLAPRHEIQFASFSSLLICWPLLFMVP